MLFGYPWVEQKNLLLQEVESEFESRLVNYVCIPSEMGACVSAVH